MQEKPVVGETKHLMILQLVWRPILAFHQLALSLTYSRKLSLEEKSSFEPILKP
jgi:hypothetical protein